MNIQILKTPRCCCGCNCQIIDRGGFLENLVAIDFRLSDFSTVTLSFCRNCAVKVSPKDFQALEEHIKRGWIVDSFVSRFHSKDGSGVAMGIWETAKADWEGFCKRCLPMPQGMKEHLLLAIRNPHVQYVNGKSIKKGNWLPFPILAIARYRIPCDVSNELALTDFQTLLAGETTAMTDA